MQWLRRDDLDLEASPPPEFRDDHLRDLVDLLPADERHMVSRIHFGSSTLAAASAELGVARSTGKKLLESGLDRLAEWLTFEDAVLPPEEDPGWDPGPIEVATCRYAYWFSPVKWPLMCQQKVKRNGLCSFHAFQSDTGIVPDVAWHERLLRGGRNIYDDLTETEMVALVNGRYRGDGRRIDQYVNGMDPVGWDPLRER